MQQLTIEHKNKTENKKKDRREGKGRVLAISRNVFRLQNTSDAYYVESESGDDVYYFVKFKPDVLESSLWYCSCKDNSTRHTIKCKHLFAIEFAIKWGTIKDIDKNFAGDIIDQSTTNDKVAIATKSVPVATRTPKSYLNDDYDF
jgi:predicted nucleic acid-binding Zn finger protein